MKKDDEIINLIFSNEKEKNYALKVFSLALSIACGGDKQKCKICMKLSHLLLKEKDE